MRANKPSPLDKKSELLKNKKEKEKVEEEEEESDEDEEEEEDDEDDDLDTKGQKSKPQTGKSALNKDIKPSLIKKEDNKAKPISQIPSGVYKSKIIPTQKQEINKPKDTATSNIGNATGSSIRRALQEKKSQQQIMPNTNTNTNSNIVQTHTQLKPPLQVKPQTQNITQTTTTTRYFRRFTESKDTTLNKNENKVQETKNIENKEKTIINNNENINKEADNKNINNNEVEKKEEKFNRKEQRIDINKEENKNEIKEKEKNINSNIKENDNKINDKTNNLTEDTKDSQVILKIELPEGKKDYVTEDVMRKNGIEIVKISLEEKNK